MEILIVSALTLVITAFSAFVILQQQRTIDRLTNKLMARDYGEYRRGLMQPEKEREVRKPLSYYDDPSIDTED